MTLPHRVTGTLRRLGGFLRGRIAVDTRSLAAFRISLGVLVLADLVLRSRNFGPMYTDDGIVSESLARSGTADGALSAFYVVSDPTAIAALFVLQAVVAVALAAGYRTRAATVISFLFVISLDHHNPFVLSYSDTLFRLLFFWAIFLPLGERWAVDAVHRERPPRPSVASVATALALSQMVFMYLLNGLHKTASPLWRSGEAAVLVFGIDEMTFLLGNTMRAVPTLLEYGGLLWFLMLLGSPLLILSWGRFRLAVVALFVGGHASFALTVRIGAFAYVAIAGLTLFLPAIFWNGSASLVRSIVTRPRRHGHGAGRIVDHLSGAAWTRDSVETRGTVGAERLARVLHAFRVFPRRFAWLRRAGYVLAVGAVVVALLLTVGVFLTSTGTVVDDGYDQHALNDELAAHSVGEHVHTVAAAVGIVQPEWSVFAPHPRTTDRYYVFGAKTVDGDRIDVYNDRPFTWDRPGNDLQRQHDTYRERFFMNSVRRGSVGGDLPAAYGDHICETYADDHDVELSYISMFEVTERITEDTIDDPGGRETERELIHRHRCES